MRQNMQVRKGDKVLVIAGNDRGKLGDVIAVYPKTGRIRVQGVNIVTKHSKPQREGENGQIITREGVIHQSNVMHWSKTEQRRSRSGHKTVGGKKVRYLIKTA